MGTDAPLNALLYRYVTRDLRAGGVVVGRAPGFPPVRCQRSLKVRVTVIVIVKAIRIAAVMIIAPVIMLIRITVIVHVSQIKSTGYYYYGNHTSRIAAKLTNIRVMIIVIGNVATSGKPQATCATMIIPE